MVVPFSDEEDKLIKQWRPQYTTGQIAELLADAGHQPRSSDSIRRRCEKLELTKGPSRAVTPLPKQVSIIDSAIDKIFGKEKSAKIKSLPKQSKTQSKDGKKILSLSDWHIPFERRDLVEDILDLHSDADIVVINGDFLDMYAASSFPKFKAIPLMKEYNIALQYLKDIQKRFGKVYLVQGNHEQRFSRLFMEQITREVSSLVCTDILTRLANGEEYNFDGSIKQMHDFHNVHYDSKAKFFRLIGKTLFVHPSAYISAPGGTAVKAARYFEGRLDFDSLVMPHTHQLGTFVYNGKLLIEQGCLTRPLDYQISDKLIYGTHANGYAVVYQDKDGNTDMKESRAFLLDTSKEQLKAHTNAQS